MVRYKTPRALYLSLFPLPPFTRRFQLLPDFHVIPYSNLSAEAEALASRLPAAVPNPVGGVRTELAKIELGLFSHLSATGEENGC